MEEITTIAPSDESRRFRCQKDEERKLQPTVLVTLLDPDLCGGLSGVEDAEDIRLVCVGMYNQ